MDEIHNYELLDPIKQKIKTLSKELAFNVLATFIYTITTYIFVLGNDFAPSGFSGILAIIAELADIPRGAIVLFAMNIPLLVWAFFKLSKRFAIFTAINVVVMCVGLFLLGKIDPDSKFKFHTFLVNIDGKAVIDGLDKTGEPILISDFGKKLFCSIISGICAGISIAMTFKNSGCLGGVDIIVSLIQKDKPHANVSMLLILVNVVVIIAGCFVFQPESICFAVIYILIFSKVSEYILSGTKRALKFEVITETPDELSAELIECLGHSVTVTRATGMFEHKEKYLLICVIRQRQIAEFEKILKKYPNTFAFSSQVSEVFGRFYK